jgi:hypothetical protein
MKWIATIEDKSQQDFHLECILHDIRQDDDATQSTQD